VLQARDELAGQRALCPECAEEVVLPGRSLPPVEALPEVYEPDPVPEAKILLCRVCRKRYPTKDVYDNDDVITCRFCYQQEASAPIKSSKRRAQPSETSHQHLDNHLATSLVVAGIMAFICLPIGVIPLYYSFQIDNLLSDREYEAARRCEVLARRWNSICFGLITLGAVFYALLAIWIVSMG